MQYAEVVINQKTNQGSRGFFYEISPQVLAEIKIGTIVLVPFHKEKYIEGVVVGLKNALPLRLKGKLKKIERILQSELIISKKQLGFADFLADFYGATFSEALFAIIPPIPRKNIIIPQKQISQKKKNNHQMHLFIGAEEDRFKKYIKLIDETKREGRGILVVFADWHDLERFKKFLEGRKVLEYSSLEKVSERFKKWLIIQGSGEAVIGSRIILLNPPENLGLIIIDKPNHEGNMEEQQPRYKSWEVAEYWQEKFGVEVWLGDSIPALKELNLIKKEKIILESKNYLIPKCEMELDNISQIKDPIAPKLLEEMRMAIRKGEDIFLLTLRKGYNTISKCTDCDYVFKCDRCQNLMVGVENKIVCLRCGMVKDGSQCPRCGGVKIAFYGWGIERIVEWLKKYFSCPIFEISKETTPKFIKPAIYVGTQAIFKYNFKPYLTGILKAETVINKPDFLAEEDGWRTIYNLALETKYKMIIQNVEENKLLRILINKKIGELFKELLIERRNNQLPPYSFIIKLAGEGKDEKKLEQEMKKIVKVLKDKIKPGEIWGPLINNQRNKKGCYHGQIIIKTKKRLRAGVFRENLLKNIAIYFDPKELF